MSNLQGSDPEDWKLNMFGVLFPRRNLIVLGVLFFDVKFSSSILKGCSSNSKVDERVKLTPFFCPGQAAWFSWIFHFFQFQCLHLFLMTEHNNLHSNKTKNRRFSRNHQKGVCVKIGWNANSLRRLEGVLSKVLSTFENPVNNERPDEVQLDDVVSGDPA